MIAVAFFGFAAESLIPDPHESATCTTVSVSSDNSAPASNSHGAPGTDSHPIHADHCGHGHAFGMSPGMNWPCGIVPIHLLVSALDAGLPSASLDLPTRPPIA